MDSINAVTGLQNYGNQLAKVDDLNNQDFTTKSASFSNHLTKALDGLNNNINIMDQATTGVINGTNNDLGSAMVKMTEAQLSVQTAVQVRNKVLEAYNDIKNMQF